MGFCKAGFAVAGIYQLQSVYVQGKNIRNQSDVLAVILFDWF